MIVDVSTSIEILRPAAMVAQYACDPDHATSWYTNIKAVEWKTPKPLKVGSEIAFVAHFLGRKLSYTYRVLEINAQNFVMKTSEGPFPMETIYHFKKIDDAKTLMTLQNRGNPKGFSRIFAPFMSTMMRKANKKDLLKLKSFLEMHT